jgi:hypothetical protein
VQRLCVVVKEPLQALVDDCVIILRSRRTLLPPLPVSLPLWGVDFRPAHAIHAARAAHAAIVSASI